MNAPRARSSANTACSPIHWGNRIDSPTSSAGWGLAELSFRDDHAQLRRSVQFLIPFGFGIKVMHKPHFASRLELVDDLSPAAGSFATMHNVSVNAGFEFPFHAGDLLGRWRQARFPRLNWKKTWEMVKKDAASN